MNKFHFHRAKKGIAMKKIAVVMILLSFSLLSACSAVQSVISPAGSAADPGQAGIDPSGMDNETKLLIGTLKLEGTAQAVTADQARTLLPLWKAVKSLSSAESTAQGEIDALYTQIKETMTADQVKAIDALNMNQEEITALMTDLGVEMEAPGDMPEVSQDQRATMQALRQSGQRPEGGFPSGGPGGGPAGGGMVIRQEGAPGAIPGQQSENGTTASVPNRGMGMSRILLDPLIQLLQERASGK